MKQQILALVIMFFSISFCNAQQIEAKKAFGGYKFYQNEKELNLSDLQQLMKNNNEALKYIKNAKTNTAFASIFGFAGGFMFGWPIGTAIGGGEANWSLAGIGVGVLGLSIPFITGANKNAKQAIELYNSSLKTVHHQKPKTEFSIISNANGFGISMSF